MGFVYIRLVLEIKKVNLHIVGLTIRHHLLLAFSKSCVSNCPINILLIKTGFC